MKRLVTFVFIIALVMPAGIANQPDVHAQTDTVEGATTEDNLWYIVDLQTTPLSKGIADAYENLPNRPADRSPKHIKNEPKELTKGNKKTGWLSQNEIVIEYDQPNQKCKNNDSDCTDSWADAKVKVKPQKGKPDWEEAVMIPAGMNENRDPDGATTYSSGFFSTFNDDQDCVDTVTGMQYSGEDCFQGDPMDHNLIQTLIPIDSGCRHFHDESIVYSTEDCADRNWTTLMEAVDEDGPEIYDTDNDKNLDDIPNGINDDQDCVDNQGNHYVGDECNVDNRFPLIDEDLVDSNGNVLRLNNDGDCLSDSEVHLFGEDCKDVSGNLKPGYTWLVDEDPVGKQGQSQTDLALCQSLFLQMEVDFDPNEDFNAVTGECDLDNAVTKGVNMKAEKKFGKHVFKEDCSPGDKACQDKQDWEKDFTASGKVVTFTYPELDKKSTTYQIQLLVNNDDDNKKCNTTLKIPGDTSAQPNNCNETDISYFTVACDDLACTFSAEGPGDNLEYQWSLGKIPLGSKSKYTSKDAYEPGKGPRTVSVTEVMLVRCPEGWDYEEDADSPVDAKKMRCRKSNQGLENQVALSMLTGLNGLGVDQSHLLSPSDKAMMGFTFAPPVIEWGWKIDEEACIFGWCFEIFYARVGYEFDMGLGFRLPMQMNLEVSDDSWPDDVWAQKNYDITTSLTPLDFSTQDYVQFCEDHNLDDEWYISDCERFAFPDFLNPEDGDEFVAYYEIFAGIIVRVVGIPLINWGIESSFDLGQACTMYNALEYAKSAGDPEVLLNLAQFLGDYATDPDASDFYQFLKDQSILCGSYTTPVGYENGDEQDPRGFPFLSPNIMPSYEIPADCTKAYLEGKVVTIKGKPRPICTNLILGTAGANLGIGLELEPRTLTDVIGGTIKASNDARVVEDIAGESLSKDVQWKWPVGHTSLESMPRTDKIIYDNYDLTWSLENDKGVIEIDDLVYYLDFRVTLYANLEFGGILSPIPDLARFKLFEISYSSITDTEGIPIPQHPGTEPLKFSVDVKNHGVDALASPNEFEVPDVNDNFEGQFNVSITNIGSLPGSFDNIQAQVTNILQSPASTTPYIFDLIKDNDGDGVDNEDPENGINDDGDCLDNTGARQPAAECLDIVGNLKTGWFWLIDEDPLDDAWRCAFNTAQSTPEACAANLSLGLLAPYTNPQTPESLRVQPLQHFTTRPGTYPVKILADSVEAKLPDFNWNQFFPIYPSPLDYEHKSGRWEAFDVTFVRVNIFFNPKANILPKELTVTPRVNGSGVYKGTIQNAGNDPDPNNADTIQVSTQMRDFNLANCSITTLGNDPDNCPYRAYPTIIQPGWVDDQLTGSYGSLPSGGAVDAGDLEITVPYEWMGMGDTSYQFDILIYSTKGDIKKSEPYTFTVEATLESQTRYIIAEIEELIVEIEAANAQGIKTCGLYPVSIHPVSLQSQRALTLVLEGKTNQALNALSANLHIMQGAFMHGVNCKSIPDDPWRNDWIQRGQAIIDDLILATTIP